MTYTPIQLKAIRLFGNKELTEWCIIRYYSDVDEQWEIIKYIRTYEKENWMMVVDAFCDWSFIRTWLSNRFSKKQEILWHEPHLEDVFMVAKEKKFHYIDITHLSDWTHELCFAWTWETDDEAIKYNPTLPLIEQDEDTLKQLLEIFKK